MSHTISQINGASSTSPSAQPLTTIFAPPADCFTGTLNIYKTGYGWTTNDGTPTSYIIRTSTQNPAAALSCFPSSYLQLGQAANTFAFDGSSSSSSALTYFSPGVCPESYVYAATAVNTPADGTAATTTAICCPPGIYTAPVSAHGLGAWCTHTTSSPATLTQGSGSAQATYAVETLIVQQGNPIFVAWQESDLPAFTPASAPVLALEKAGASFPTTSTSQTTTSTAKTQPSSTGTTSPDSGLSTTAAAAIGVGATVAGLAILAGIIYFCLSRRRKAFQQRRKLGAATSAETLDKPELDSNSMDRTELDANAKRFSKGESSVKVHELDGPHGSAELFDKFGDVQEAIELDAGYRGHEVGNAIRKSM